jgi:hypothetical protein
MSHRNHIAPAQDLEKGGDGSWKVARTESAKLRERKTLMVSQEKRERADKFDAFYKQLGSKCKPDEKRIDCVLVHPKVNLNEVTDEDDRKETERLNLLRGKFEAAMKADGLLIQQVEVEDNVYTKIHCPFRRMCEEAEAVSLEMPLLGVSACFYYTSIAFIVGKICCEMQ